jgi:hypothetical protein
LQLLRSRRRFWAGCAVAGITGSLAALLVFGSGWLTSLGRVGHQESRYAIPVRIEQLGIPDRAVQLLAAAALVVGALWLLRQALQGRTRLALGACLLVLTTPWLLPWYATWSVVLAAVEEDAAAQILALAVAAYLLPARVPF